MQGWGQQGVDKSRSYALQSQYNNILQAPPLTCDWQVGNLRTQAGHALLKRAQAPAGLPG
eukprot:7247057-Heterocapsa_arctica.AAC.1